MLSSQGVKRMRKRERKRALLEKRKTALNGDKWLQTLSLAPLKKPHWQKVKKAKKSQIRKIDHETAQLYVKEARFQYSSAMDYLRECLEMEDLPGPDAVMRHPTKVKRLLVKDREQSGLKKYSDELLFL